MTWGNIEDDREFYRAWITYRPTRKSTDFTDEEYAVVSRVEEDYYANEWPKVQQSIEGMINDMSAIDRQQMRLRYLSELGQAKKAAWIKKPSAKLEREIRRITFESKVFLGRVEGLSKEKIDQARQYPIQSLIEHRHFMAICPFHPDKSPSMNIKNNFYFCHGCGEHGDVIDFVMRMKKVSFKAAVESLV